MVVSDACNLFWKTWDGRKVSIPTFTIYGMEGASRVEWKRQMERESVFAWRVCACGGLMIRLQGNTAMCSEWPNCNRTCNLEALMCDKESAELRKLAHSILDKGWKTKNERNRMYDNLKEYAGKDIHFGKMSKSELKEIIPKLKSHYRYND